jgi:3-oxoacyl-[acyl-carrier protein] reductase
MKELDGDWIALDITGQGRAAADRAPPHEKHGGVDVVVHNAGITRDKKLANMSEDQVRAGHRGEPHRTRADHPRAARPGRDPRERPDRRGRLDRGIAGNVGQTNYAAVQGRRDRLVDSLADELEDGITINAVAPGFIITQMTAAVPFATREVGSGSTPWPRAGCRSTWPRRSPGTPRPARPRSTATWSASAAR